MQSYSGGSYAVPHPLFVETSPGVFTQVGTTAAKSPGASGYGGTSPTYAGSHSQTSHGVYVGLEGDVVKDLSVGAAARYESYSSFGSATVGKLNAIWHFSDEVALRATVGNRLVHLVVGGNWQHLVTVRPDIVSAATEHDLFDAVRVAAAWGASLGWCLSGDRYVRIDPFQVAGRIREVLHGSGPLESASTSSGPRIDLRAATDLAVDGGYAGVTHAAIGARPETVLHSDADLLYR